MFTQDTYKDKTVIQTSTVVRALTSMVQAVTSIPPQPERAKRPRFSDRRVGEGDSAYKLRMADRRAKDAARKAAQWQADKDAIQQAAHTRLVNSLESAVIFGQKDAVMASVYQTPGMFTRAPKTVDNGDGTLTLPGIQPFDYLRDGASNDVSGIGKVKLTRRAQDIIAGLTENYSRGFSAPIGKIKRPNWNIERIDKAEAIYRNMSPAQRSKGNPMFQVRPYTVTRVAVGTRGYTDVHSVIQLEAFNPELKSNPVVVERKVRVVSANTGKVTTQKRFTCWNDNPQNGRMVDLIHNVRTGMGGSNISPMTLQERMDHATVVPDLRMVSPVLGLICARDRGGVYGSGQTNIPYKPITTASHAKLSVRTSKVDGIARVIVPGDLTPCAFGVAPGIMTSAKSEIQSAKLAMSVAGIPQLARIKPEGYKPGSTHYTTHGAVAPNFEWLPANHPVMVLLADGLKGVPRSNR